jgi:hypothetical protein
MASTAAACGSHADRAGGVTPPAGDASSPAPSVDASTSADDASAPADDASTPLADGSAPSSDASTPLGGGETPVPYLQVDLNITNGQVSGNATGLTQGQVAFAAVTPLSLPPPPAALGGEYGLVALKDNQPQAFAWVSFPSSVLEEGPDQNGEWASQSVSLTGSATTVFVPYDSYDALEVIDASGKVVATQSGVPVFPSADLRYFTSSDGFSPRPGLIILGPAAAKAYMQQFPAISTFNITYDINADPNGQQAVMAALAYVAPEVLKAVHYIIIGDIGPFFAGETAGSAVVIDTYVWTRIGMTPPYLTTTLVHESAHVYAYLLDGLPQSLIGSTPQIRALAAQAAADPFKAGFTAFWEQMHNDGVQNQMAVAYTHYANPVGVTPKQAGLVTPYGGRDPGEDIATYTEFLQVPDDSRSSYQPNPQVQRVIGQTFEPTAPGPAWFCSEFVSASPAFPATSGNFPVEDTIPFVKLQLLVNAGFITPAKLTGCIGNNLPLIRETGVFVEHGDGSEAMAIPKVPGQGGLAAGVDATGNAWISTHGNDTSSASVSLAPDAKNNPLGWFRFAKRGASGMIVGPQASFLGGVTDGLVFVQEASSSLLSFAIFNLEMRSISSSGSLMNAAFPYASFSIPIPPASSCPITGWSCSLFDPSGTMIKCFDNYLAPGDGDYNPNSTTFGPDLCNPGIAANYLDPGSSYYGYHTDLEKTPCQGAPCGGCSLPADACLANDDNTGADVVTWFYQDCRFFQASCLELPASAAYSGAPDESFVWLTP